MFNFEIMERSLKIAWIKRIAESSNASWKKIPNQALNQYGGLEFLIECGYDPNLLNLENLPEFDHTILNCWHDFRTNSSKFKQIPIKKQIIWNNRYICIDGKPIYIKSWCTSGIRCIEDLLNVNFKFLTLSEMKEKYNFEFPFTTYYGLLRETSLKLFSTKEAYSSILDKSFLAPTAEGRIIYSGFTKEEIPYIYMLPFKILKEPKLIMFQVKIIHNILPTQSSLFRVSIADTDVCPLCNLESQSLKHMLITCNVSSLF